MLAQIGSLLGSLSGISRFKVMAIAALVATVAITIGTEEHQKATLRAEVTALALRADSAAAALDTTRTISATNAQLAVALGDSLHAVQRLVVQMPQRMDSIDHALRLERIGKYALTARLDSLQRRLASQSGVTEDSTDHIRRASFDVRQAPYTVTAAVELPPAPDTAHLDMRIALDPIPVVARLSCAPPNAQGIRAASIEATAPRWAAIEFSDVQQSTDLCASPALTHAAAGGHSFVHLRPLMVGAGRIVLPDGTSRWGGFIGAGLAFGG